MFFRCLVSNIIQVKVGADQQIFNVHKDLLCYYSSYFERALNGDFKEAIDKSIELDDEDPFIFQAFVSWLYTERLYEDKKEPIDPKSEDREKRTTVNLSQRQLMQIWLFGEKRGIPALQNKAINLYHQNFSESRLLDVYLLNTVYEQTLEDSKLRKYLAALYAFSGLKFNMRSGNPGRVSQGLPLRLASATPREFKIQ